MRFDDKEVRLRDEAHAWLSSIVIDDHRHGLLSPVSVGDADRPNAGANDSHRAPLHHQRPAKEIRRKEARRGGG
jgi:hypothetical protein